MILKVYHSIIYLFESLVALAVGAWSGFIFKRSKNMID